MIDMTGVEFENFFAYQPMSCNSSDSEMQYSLDPWPETTFVDAYASAQQNPVHAKCLDDIEQIYTVLHKCVDQMISNITVSRLPQLDQIREQNHRLIDKLRALEITIGADTTTATAATRAATRAAAVVFNSGSPICSPVHTEIACAGSSSNTPNMPDVPLAVNNDRQSPTRGHGRPSFAALNHDSRLTKKLLQIGNREARMQVVEFAAQLERSDHQNGLPDILHLPNASRITDVPNFLQLVTNLGLAIESSVFGEQNCRIKKRIALAHFYHAYTLAQDHPDMFLSWCDNQQVQSSSILPKGGSKSVVQHRFADLIFSRAQSNGGSFFARTSDKINDTKRRTSKIQMWRKSGKKWAQFIQRFGYGILLLLPCSLSDEDLRTASDEIIACGLDLIDSRKHLFADMLRQANELLDAHFLSQDGNPQLSSAHSSGRFESGHWDDLLNAPALVT